eukprot:TRINITY_DN18313_c0_g1_i1.p1 TRINITY_DN18313_c0_g1~~TRINITY_DN18313_c0_g1_i1.p1  ORF type:complete len:796 (-),score=216.81 TRINITY_DN18313_c0_g1_i1:135-2243(-)
MHNVEHMQRALAGHALFGPLLYLACSEQTVASRLARPRSVGMSVATGAPILRDDDTRALVQKRFRRYHDGAYNRVMRYFAHEASPLSLFVLDAEGSCEEVLRSARDILEKGDVERLQCNASDIHSKMTTRTAVQITCADLEGEATHTGGDSVSALVASHTSCKVDGDAEKYASQLTALLHGLEMPPYVYSYPVKGAFVERPELGTEEGDGDEAAEGVERRWRQSVVHQAWGGYSGDVNLYIHIPYCQMKCSFCNLLTTMNTNEHKMQRYMEAVKAELRMVAREMRPSGQGNNNKAATRVRTVHFGGGTPTLLSPAEVESVLEVARECFEAEAVEEIAIEGAPSSLASRTPPPPRAIGEEQQEGGGVRVDEQRMRGFLRAGISRISIGAQTLVEEELPSVSRANELGLAVPVVRAAVEMGFRNVNVDLIYGLEGQSLENVLESVRVAAALGVHTVTLYCLAVRKKTKYGRVQRSQHGGMPFHELDCLHEWYGRVRALLSELGYEQKTLVLFARGSNGGNRQEEVEFDGVPTVGLGAGARSYAPAVQYTSDSYSRPALPPEIVNGYVVDVLDRGMPAIRNWAALDKDEQARRFFILQLLRRSGVDVEQYRSTFEELCEDRFGAQIRALVRMGRAEYVFEEAAVREVVRGPTLTEEAAAVMAGSAGIRPRPFLRLTPRGLAESSAIAQLFFSNRVQQLQAESSYG